MAENEPPHLTGAHTYKGIVLPNIILDSSVDALPTFEVRPDDVWICTYPKTGTYWHQEFYLPWTRAEELQNPPNMAPFLDVVAKAKSPRVILSHLPIQMLPTKLEEKAKVIYVARNPKDVLNSNYNMVVKGKIAPTGFSWEFLLGSFMEDSGYLMHLRQFLILLLPLFIHNDRWFSERLIHFPIKTEPAYGPWLDHNLAFWKLRDRDNVIFLFYENLKKNPVEGVQQVAAHIGVDLTAEEVQKVVEYSSFKGMSKTYATRKTDEKGVDKDFHDVVNAIPFMNKGVSGQWKERFTVAQNEMFDKWYEEKMKGVDLTFEFE
ncbi:sulfotransferase 1A2-like [Diadema antillarum]|uniref:sulfotransferase 1A2-like n=1 Tax=Diadema antillarum TaxID=105358 RepID=UPI003A86EFC3